MTTTASLGSAFSLIALFGQKISEKGIVNTNYQKVTLPTRKVTAMKTIEEETAGSEWKALKLRKNKKAIMKSKLIFSKDVGQIAILILLVFPVEVMAQYEPIAKSDSVSWLVKHEIWDEAITESLYLADTITLDSKTYYAVMLEGNYNFNGLIGYFREDSSTGRAWFWGINDTSEYLIMDLSLAIGDSFFVKMYGFPNEYSTVINIDTVESRKTLTLDYVHGGGFIYENLKFIEGVGPSASLLFQIDEVTSWQINSLFGYLVCKAYNDTTIIYAWDTINYECGPMFSNVLPNDRSEYVLFFPNPATNMITVNGPPEIEITFFTPVGKEIFKTKAKTINIDQLSRGIYYVQIKKDEKLFATAKLIIN